jgi:hypothetical protein
MVALRKVSIVMNAAPFQVFQFQIPAPGHRGLQVAGDDGNPALYAVSLRHTL